MIHWLHHLLKIQCEECAASRVCQTCEVLKDQLAIERSLNKVLMDKLLPARSDVPIIQQDSPKPLSQHVPWQVKRQILEAQDREKAKLVKSLEDLEQEVGIDTTLKVQE